MQRKHLKNLRLLLKKLVNHLAMPENHPLMESHRQTESLQRMVSHLVKLESHLLMVSLLKKLANHLVMLANHLLKANLLRMVSLL